MKPLIIIPAYNEAENIAFVINDIKEHFQEADILVVNDGSTDSTGEIAKTAGVTVINHPFNMGIGAAVQTGYRYADLKVSIHAPARGATIPLSYMMIWLMFDVDNPTTLQIGEPNCTLHRSWGSDYITGIGGIYKRHQSNQVTLENAEDAKEALDLILKKSQLYPTLRKALHGLYVT